MKRILTLILSLTLAACLDTSAAIRQPETRIPTPTPQDTPTATATATEAPTVCTVTADALHVRSGPGVTFWVVGYLYTGDIVTVQNQRGAWFDIGTGWIHSNYCEE